MAIIAQAEASVTSSSRIAVNSLEVRTTLECLDRQLIWFTADMHKEPKKQAATMA